MNRIGRGSGCYDANGPDRMLDKFDVPLAGNAGKLDLKIFYKPALICCQFGVEELRCYVFFALGPVTVCIAAGLQFRLRRAVSDLTLNKLIPKVAARENY